MVAETPVCRYYIIISSVCGENMGNQKASIPIPNHSSIKRGNEMVAQSVLDAKA